MYQRICVSCVVCVSPLSGDQRKYCSHVCKEARRRANYVKKKTIRSVIAAKAFLAFIGIGEFVRKNARCYIKGNGTGTITDRVILN